MKLALENIAISFSHKCVLKNLSIEFSEGMIHALLGENGAGKSTTANIICGELKPDSGKIYLDGVPVRFKSPKDAIKHGIYYVHQRPMLADNISIKENLLLGLNRQQKQNITEQSEKWLKGINLNTYVRDLGSDLRFFVSLCRAFLQNPHILILDEPTALLDQRENHFLFENLKEYADKGNTIIIITHSISEAQEYCDTISFIEDGIIKPDFIPAEFTVKTHTTSDTFFSKNINHSNRIQFNHVTCKPAVQPGITDVSFSAKGKEITLIKGQSEDGLLTLENIITGMNTASAEGIITTLNEEGRILYSCDLKHNRFTTRDLRKHSGFKTGIIPTDKKFRGSNPELKIETLLSRDEPDTSKSKAFARTIIELSQIDIQINEKTSALSGGMLQRLIYNREICTNPQLLILAQPLQGLDSNAVSKISYNIRKLADKGTIVIILSSTDFPEEYCNKIYNLKKGKLEEVK